MHITQLEAWNCLIDRQETALRPGTRANHRSILTKFVTFIARHGGDFTKPSDEWVCIFFEHCLKSVKAPNTIKNYSFALASAYRRMGLPHAPFEAFKVENALVSIDKNVRYCPSPSLPVTPAILRKVIRVAGRLREGKTVVAAVVMLFHTFFRLSNLAAVTTIQFDHHRQLTRGDVSVTREGLSIRHKWSKSHQSSAHSVIVNVPRVKGSVLCPVAAYLDMLSYVPTRHPRQPMLMFNDGNHMPAPYIRRVWNAIVAAINLPQGNIYTIHGIRRGAATHVLSCDPTARDAIMKHGMWRSNAVDCYLPDTSGNVFNIMKKTL